MNRYSLMLHRLPGSKSWMAAALLLLQFACSANNDPSLEYDSDSTLNPAGPAAPDDDSLAPADPRNPANWFGNGDLEAGDWYWYAQGDGVTATRTSAQAHGGTYSLLVAGRSAGWHAPVMPLLKTLPSGEYAASVWVRLAAGEDPASVQLSIKKQVSGEQPTFTGIGAAEVTADGWTRLSATFDYVSPGRMEDLTLYVESPDETLSYYVDDLELVGLSNVIVNGGVEEGTSPWRSQGAGVMISQSSEQKHTGDNSLLVSGRVQNWNGPVMDLPVLGNGRVYSASAWVRLAPGTPSTRLNLTLKRTPTGGTSEYIQLGSAEVTATEWVELSGSFTHLVNGPLQEHLLYIESIEEGAAASFYVDDLELAVSQNALSNGDFESGTGGWFALSSGEPPVAIERSNAAAITGSYSLLVTNRSQEWHGPATNLNLTVGNVYNLSCQARLTAGTPDTNAILTIKMTEDAMDNYIQVDAEPATASDWAELSGVFIYDPIGTVTDLLMYVHAESPTAAFYIDACAVTQQ